VEDEATEKVVHHLLYAISMLCSHSMSEQQRQEAKARMVSALVAF
jgi:hypothetical protein